MLYKKFEIVGEKSSLKLFVTDDSGEITEKPWNQSGLNHSEKCIMYRIIKPDGWFLENANGFDYARFSDVDIAIQHIDGLINVNRYPEFLSHRSND